MAVREEGRLGELLESLGDKALNGRGPEVKCSEAIIRHYLEVRDR